jgi:hypothetical protein
MVLLSGGDVFLTGLWPFDIYPVYLSYSPADVGTFYFD